MSTTGEKARETAQEAAQEAALDEVAVEGLPSPDELYNRYEKQRRLRLTRTIVPPFMGLNTLALPFLVGYYIYLVTGHGEAQITATNVLIFCGVSLALDALFTVAYIAARRQAVTLATLLATVATSATIMAYEIVWTSGHSLDRYAVSLFAAYGVAIVLAGVLGARTAMLLATLVFNVFTVALLLLGYPAAELHGQQRGENFIIGMAAIIIQWAFYGLMIGVLNGYRSTLRDLGESRFLVARAERLDDLKDQFISSVNHELRNPVMAVLANVEGLYLTMDRATPERRKELSKRALDAGLKLRALIQSILDTRRLDQTAADFTPEMVNVRAAVEAAALLVDPSEANMVERDLRMAVPADLHVWGDMVRVEQIVTNLLSNAVKYSSPGTPIEVSARRVSAFVAPDGGGRWARKRPEERRLVELRVRDFGLGVPPDDAPLLFQRFVRLPRDLASKVIGNGLGLYLCRTLSEAMGGSIRVESSGVAGEGSAFIVELPEAPVDAPVDAPPPLVAGPA